MVRAKFRLASITMFDGTMKKYQFLAIYDTSIPEDKLFSKYTPNGEFCIFVDNPVVEKQFELGKYYYFDITPVV